MVNIMNDINESTPGTATRLKLGGRGAIGNSCDPSTRRPALALAVAIAFILPLAPTASAMGPGGWDHLGHGATLTVPSLNGAVYALNGADNPGVLYVGGNFTAAGGIANADRIARWNGIAWSALGSTPISNGSVNAIAYHAGKVYVGGTFLNAGGNPNADFLAVWDGAWAPFCTPATPGAAFGGTVNALQIIGNTLYVGGAFQNGGKIAAADYLLACDLTTGASSSTVLHDGDFTGAVYALAADSNGVLYAGGNFINLDTILEADYVAAYDGAWHAMGVGPWPGFGAVEGIVRGLTANGTDVYIGTDAIDVAGIAAADHVVKWNGSEWRAVGSNTAGTNGWFSTLTFINTLTTSKSLLFAAGSFQNANGIATADNIAYFDGSTWRPIGSNGAGNGALNANMVALANFGGKVHAASGNLTSAGGDVMARSVAAYALRLPDARIGLTSTGPFSGDGVYSPTAVGESRTISVTRGQTGTFYVSIQNDGLVAAAFTIKGTGGAGGITVRYYRGATNITTAVKAGTYGTGLVAPRGSITLKMAVDVAASSATIGSFLVQQTSVPGTPIDAVKAIVNAK